MRDELLSMMSACRSTVVRLIHVLVRSKWIYAFEIFQNRCSICSLLICIFYEWCSTCLRFVNDIWFEFAINSNANRWKRHVFQLSKSRSKWLETIRKFFVNSDFVWLRVCWLFSIFYSWACVKRRRRKWKSNEQRKCTTLESCEKSLFRWKSTTSWISWFVSSFFLNFSYVWISFQSCVDLHVENSNIDSRLNRVRVNLDRDRHVELFRIFDEMNQFVFNWSEHKFMSNRSSFAELVHFFEISTIFVDVFFINQYVNIIDVLKKFCVRFEFVAHF
jgi:hypothetical protein